MTILYRVFLGFRTGFYCLFSAFLLLAGSLGLNLPLAHADIIYRIENVAIDVTATNAVKAREKAFEKAQLEAFGILAKRLLTPDEYTYFSLPKSSAVASLVQDYEVTNEQISADRYKGAYTFRFRPDAVRAMLAGLGFAYTEMTMPPMLILPYYFNGKDMILWEDDNPWMQAWANWETKSAVAPFSVPLGDIHDIANVSSKKPLVYDIQKFKQLMARYNVGQIFITIAMPSNGEDGALKVDIYSAQEAKPKFLQAIQVQIEDGADKNRENGKNIYTQAIVESLSFLQGHWKQLEASSPHMVQEFRARVQFSTLPEWVETKNALEKVSGVQALKVDVIKPRQADLVITFIGDSGRLMQALHQADMSIIAPHLNNSGYSWQPQGYIAQLPYEVYLNKYKRF